MKPELLQIAEHIITQTNVLYSLSDELKGSVINIKDTKLGDSTKRSVNLINEINTVSAELNRSFRKFNRLRNDINNYEV